MDGYAVRAGDVAKAPVRLKIIGEVAAGRPFAHPVGAGEAARIFTGGVMPEGADAVVIQEHTKRDGDHVERGKVVAAGPPRPRPRARFQSRRRPARGRTPAHRARSCARCRHESSAPSGASAAEGCAVRHRRRVGAGRSGAGARARSSLPTTSRWRRWRAAKGRMSSDLGIVADRLDDTVAAVRRAREGGADILVTSGGASVGDYDLVQKAFTAEGMELVVLEAGAAPRPPVDARAARRHARARRSRQSGLAYRLRAFCSWCR